MELKQDRPIPMPRLYCIAWLSDFCNALLVFTLTRYLAEYDGNPIHLGWLGELMPLVML